MNFSKCWFKNKIADFQGGAYYTSLMDKTPTAKHRDVRNDAEITQHDPWKICKKHSRKMGTCSNDNANELPRACLCITLINNGYLTFQVLNCRKQILTQVFSHCNLMLTQKTPFYGKH